MRLLNELHDAMMSGNKNDAAGPLISSLVQLAHQHFRAEEELMEAAAFPALAAHRAKHRELMTKITEFITRYRNGDKTVYSQFMYFVRDWLTRHMEKEDQEYAPWLAARGIR